MPDADARTRKVHRLVGIYHASGTPLGELLYLLRSRVGRAHCALCDITHGTLREKQEWKQCRSELPVPFVAAHLDERGPGLAAFTDGRTPCVVAETSTGLVMVVDANELAACDGSPSCLVEAIATQSKQLDLVLE